MLEDSEERGGSQALANANGVLKVIDMGALICSPIAFGAIATCASLAAAVAAMGAFAVLACAAELPVVAHLAAGSPALEAMGSRRASVDEPRGQAAAPLYHCVGVRLGVFLVLGIAAFFTQLERRKARTQGREKSSHGRCGGVCGANSRDFLYT